MKSLNVLITAGSRRVPLVAAFRRALTRVGCPGSVIVTDVNPLAPAIHMADRAYRVRLSSEPGYLDEVLRVSETEHVGLIVPTIDDELTLFAMAAPVFEARDIRIAVSPPETTGVCHDKYATCRVLRSHGVPAAATYLPSELDGTLAFPLFIKPRFGRGSVSAFKLNNARELAVFLDYVPDPVVQTYLDGPEFTIDMLCDWSGRPVSIVPRERIVIRAGVSDRGRTTRDPALIELAEVCSDVLSFAGPVNIQCRIVNGEPTIFEINPRFSGGIPLTIEAGADFPRLLVQLALGQTVLPAIGRFRNNLLMTSYETAIFLTVDELARSFTPRTIAEVA